MPALSPTGRVVVEKAPDEAVKIEAARRRKALAEAVMVLEWSRKPTYAKRGERERRQQSGAIMAQMLNSY